MSTAPLSSLIIEFVLLTLYSLILPRTLPHVLNTEGLVLLTLEQTSYGPPPLCRLMGNLFFSARFDQPRAPLIALMQYFPLTTEDRLNFIISVTRVPTTCSVLLCFN